MTNLHFFLTAGTRLQFMISNNVKDAIEHY